MEWRQWMFDPAAERGREWHGTGHLDMHSLLS